jgi:hypothetical protein
VLSLSRSQIGLHALLLLHEPHTFGIWVYTLLVILSHVVMSVMHVFHLYDVEFGLCLSVTDVVCHPSICDLTM